MSYDGSDLSELNTARRALGDISNDSATELLTDDEIEVVIGAHGYDLGVALLAEGLASKYARRPSQGQLPGGLGATWGERIKQWNLVASQYRALAAQEIAQASLVIPTSVSVATRIAW